MQIGLIIAGSFDFVI